MLFPNPCRKIDHSCEVRSTSCPQCLQRSISCSITTATAYSVSWPQRHLIGSRKIQLNSRPAIAAPSVSLPPIDGPTSIRPMQSCEVMQAITGPCLLINVRSHRTDTLTSGSCGGISCGGDSLGGVLFRCLLPVGCGTLPFGDA
jgi:hypothetical protein